MPARRPRRPRQACLRGLGLARRSDTAAACRAAAEPYDWDRGLAPLCERLYASGADKVPLLGNVLITGAGGYVGGRLVAALAQEGTETRALVREPARWLEIPRRYATSAPWTRAS